MSRVPCYELVDLLFFFKENVKMSASLCNILTRFNKYLLNPSSKSEVLKTFRVKDPPKLGYMYLHALKKYMHQDLHIFQD